MWAGIAASPSSSRRAFDYRWLKTLSWPVYVLQLGLLVLTLAIGDGVGNSARWITIGPFTFQFSELAKILMIIVLANYLASRQRRLDSLRTILGACVLVIPPLGAGHAPARPRDLARVRRDPRRDALDVGRQPEVAGGAGRRGHRDGPDRVDLHPARLPEGAPDARSSTRRRTSRTRATSSTSRRSRSARVAGSGGASRTGRRPRATSCRSRRPTSCSRSWPRSSGSSARWSLFVLFVAAALADPGRRLALARPVRDAVRVGHRLDDPVPARSSTSGMVMGIMPITGIPLPFVTHGGASLVSIAIGLGHPPEHQHPADARRVVTGSRASRSDRSPGAVDAHRR